MKTLLLVGLVVTTAFAQAPETISGKIYDETSYYFDYPDYYTQATSFGPNGTYDTMVREHFSTPALLSSSTTRTIQATDKGTYTYVKTGPTTATLTLTSTTGLGVVVKNLVFADENFGVGSTSPNDFLSFFLSSVADAPIVNASARGPASASKPLIVGFYVATRRRYVLVRAIGPSLAQFDVQDAAADTTIEVVPAQPPPPDGSLVKPSNDDWETDSYHQFAAGATLPVSTVGAFMGAFPLPTGSKDAALALLLPPGAYTAVVRTKSDTPAEVLGEVYVVP